MGRDLIINVVAKKDSKQLEELAVEFEALKKEVDDSGKSLQKHASFGKLLDAQLQKTRNEVKLLGEEFNRTGNVDVFRSLRNSEKNLAGLERLKKQLSTALQIDIGGGNGKNGSFFGKLLGGSIPNAAIKDLTAQGIQLGDAFGGGFISSASKVFAAGGPALLPAAAGLVTEIGGMISGAITAGVGAGGLAVGIAGAFKDPAVQSAGKQLEAALSGTFAGIGKGFVGPVENALTDLTSAAQAGSADVAAAFAPLAKAIGPIEKGIEGLVGNALPGLSKAFANAEPVLEEVGKQLPGLGRAIGDALGKITNNIGANKAAIALIFQTVDKTIEGLGSFIGALDSGFAHFLHIVQPIAHIDEKLFGWLPVVGDQVHGAAREVDGLVGALDDTGTASGTAATGAKSLTTDFAALSGVLNKTTENADTLAGAMSDKVLGSLLAGDHAVLGFQESLTGLSDAFGQNGKQLDITTKAGQQNREAVLSVVEANVRQYDANLAAGDSALEAAGKYDANTASLEAQLRKAHLTQGEIDGLIGKYKNVPDKVNTNIALEGLTDAVNNLSILSGAIAGIPRYVKIEAAIEAVDTSGLAQNLPNRHRAAGGPVMAGQPYIVGEQRPELFVPNVNGTIIPRIPTLPGYAPVGRAGAGSGWSGMSAPAAPVVHVYIGGEEITDRIQVVVDQRLAGVAGAVSGGPRL